MTAVPLFNRAGERISSVKDWELLASPGKARWANGYSAKALAEAWTADRGPGDLLDLFAEHGDGRFNGLRFERAIAEAQTHFDEFGGPRNHDLLVWANDERGSFPIGIEAKVNEPLGQTLGQYLSVAERREESGEDTNAPERLRTLTTAIAGAELDERPELRPLRFQLFSSLAGTLAASESDRAVLIVHEMRTGRSDQREDNSDALTDFLTTVFQQPRPGTGNWLRGPLRIKASRARLSNEIDFWIGHLVTDERGL